MYELLQRAMSYFITALSDRSIVHMGFIGKG